MGYGTGPAPKKGHVHDYNGRISLQFGRPHPYQGVSSAAYGGVDQHTHTLTGTINLSRGPAYKYNIVTGPGIPSGQGQHAHRYSGEATAAGGRGPQVHRFSGVTAPAQNDIVD